MQKPASPAVEPMTVDEFLLTKAEARWFIRPEEADAIRAQLQAEPPSTTPSAVPQTSNPATE